MIHQSTFDFLLTREQVLAPDDVQTITATFATIEPMVAFLDFAVR